MRPPYHPDHVERVFFAGGETVVARCSCGWTGRTHDLHFAGAARGLADDFNAHRTTYVDAEGSLTRSEESTRTYFSPGDTTHDTDARQPSGQRTQPSHQPGYQRPSSCSTSTVRGSSKRRTSSSGTAATVGGGAA